MKLLDPFQQHAMVVMHLPGGFTRVRLYALAHGEGWLEVPTEVIPVYLRSIGSKVLVTVPRFSVEDGDQVAEIRMQVHNVLVEELPISEGQSE